MTETLGTFIQYLRQTAYPKRTGKPALTVTTLSQLLDHNHADLSRWEHDKRVPSIDMLQKIVQAVQGTNEDFYYMLGLLGILQPTRFPPYEKTIAMLRKLADYVGRLNVPSYILDYRGRFWVVNQAVAAMVGVDHEVLREMLRGIRLDDGRYDAIDYMDIVFNSNLPFQSLFVDWERTARNQIARFKTINLRRRHEPFYQGYIERARKRLLPNDFADFERLWNAVDFDSLDTLTESGGDFAQTVLDMLTTEIALQQPDGTTRRYTLRAETVFPALHYFDHIIYVPEGGCMPLGETNDPALCLWEVLPDLKERLRDEWAEEGKYLQF